MVFPPYNGSTMNIPEMGRKIKTLAEDGAGDWGPVAIILLVGLVSFGLGRLSALEEAWPAVALLAAPEAAGMREMAPGGLYVASRRGSTYHYPWCSGAQAIATANKVWFSSEEEARRAGYRAAKNCKGLGAE